MKKLFLLLCVAAALSTHAQTLTSVVPGNDRKAMVGEQIGLTKVLINYDRPGVKGREGKIWSQLVHEGFKDLGFGSAKAAPWRAGANENTTIEFSTDVKIEGKPLAAGKYGLFIAWDPNECTVIFSKNNGSWGSYYYNEAEDALRVKVKPQTTDRSVEWLKYEFTNQTNNSATVSLMWEKMIIPFKVEVDLVQTQLASYRQELRTRKGFQWQPWVEAALYCVQNNTNLEEALLWADTATSPIFGGSTQFQAWSTKAQVLQKLGRGKEADEIMQKYLPLANMQEVHQYGRQLLQVGKKKEALEIFKQNNAKYPNEFTTLFGLARGYSANADYDNALKYAKLALAVVPNPANKTVVENAIKKLEESKDFN
jgi:tetratricopeptide (TPR) repeat protein